MTHKVRTTMRPDQEIEVGDVEYAQLQADGLLVHEDAQETVPPAIAAPANPSATEKKNTSATKSS